MIDGILYSSYFSGATLTRVGALIAGAAFIYTALFCIYQVTLHPLSRYPGPFLAKFTDLYAAYHAWRGDIHLDMCRCHEVYGDFVRYGPDRMNINTAGAVRDIYASGKNLAKSKNYDVMVHQATNTFTTRDKTEHGRRRRVISQGFSDSAIRNYEPSMVALIHKFCNRLCQTVEEERKPNEDDQWQPARNMSQWCNYLTFDLMADVIFGAKYNMLERVTYRYVTDAICISNIRVSTILQAPALRFCRLDKLLFPKSIIARDLFLRFVGKLLRDSQKVDHVGKKDLFGILSTVKDPQTGSTFTQREIFAESTTLVVAGADTASTALTGLFFYLSRFPTTYCRAMEEVRSTFDSVEDIGLGAKLNSCKFLRACIDETMRMSPSVGVSLAREVQEGGAEIDGHYFPAGCDVGTPIYSMHHNPAYFPDPFHFDPERWIIGQGQTTRESLDHMLAVYQPFSLGSRGCVGKGLAIIELMLTAAIVLWRLDFKVAEGCTAGGDADGKMGRRRKNEFQLWDHITSAKDGPSLHFRKRRLDL